MEQITLREAADALHVAAPADAVLTGVAIDNRKVQPGMLFVCIRGERFDGHDFAPQAAAAGAAAVLTERPLDVACPQLVVQDTRRAFLDLAGYYRSRFSIPVVGLTGSVGKTTTKDFTALVLGAKYNCLKTQGNLNNEIGVPQTLFSMDRSTGAAVIEMGMNHFGEIRSLVTRVRPNLGIITNIGVSHIENLGSREGILQAKMEITEGLTPGAPLILNGDNDLLQTVHLDDRPVILAGIENKACAYRAENIRETGLFTTFDIKFAGTSCTIKLPTVGIHNVYDALLAFAAGVELGVEPQAAAKALAAYVPSGMRQKIVQESGRTVIEDCYNASPDSMRAALKTLVSLPAKKHIAVLADMLELGSYSDRAHHDIGLAAAQAGADALYCYGPASAHLVQGAKEAGLENAFWFGEKAALSEALFNACAPGDAVLFKGSRGMKLEEVIHFLYERWANQ